MGGASGAKQTVRLSLPPKPSAAKETVRLELPPKPGAKAPAPAGGKEIKLIVPQADESAASAKIPESAEAEVPTMDSGQAQPAKPAGGLKGGPPGAAKAFGPTMPGKVAQDPGTGLPDSTNSAMALPAKKALPKPEVASASSGAAVVGGVRIRWFDWILATLALGAAIGAVVMVFLRAQ
ncbi:MAG: hypothetical protein EBS05_24180 [Proteobacteria bacterium]|nr:hypothetical protein [Pseudomonadota bacterium]